MAETRARGGPPGPVQDEKGQDEEGQSGPGLFGGQDGNGYGQISGVAGLRMVAGQSAPARHDPRIDPPTRADRRRLWRWAALLAFCPICLGVVVWAALGMNGSYPTVNPPVPTGWQSVPGIYASFSVPGSWSLKQFLSDASGDIFYSGPGGGVGESVTQADRVPQAHGPLPEIVGTFLGWKYQVSSVADARIANATAAWRYRFHLANGKSAMGVLAWVKPTQSEVWLVATRDSAATEKAISTLTLAS